jgi:hypothetical protein
MDKINLLLNQLESEIDKIKKTDYAKNIDIAVAFEDLRLSVRLLTEAIDKLKGKS